jgi:hypothetical protein
MKVLADGKFVARDAGGTWPTPMDEPDTSLEWRLRYANHEQLVKDRFLAASVVSAYRELIRLPRTQRDAVIRDLRAAMKPPQSDAVTSGGTVG